MRMLSAFAALAAMIEMPGMDLGIKESASERLISNASIQALSNEYKLIQQKQSRLSRSQRDMVEARVQYLIKKGHLAEDGSFNN